MKPKTPPKVLSQNWLFRSRLFHAQAQELEFSNGERRQYERLNPDNHDAVLCLPLLDKNTVLLIREYGAGIGKYYLSFPKGAVDPGESLETCANRELKEEIGYGANSIHLLRQLHLSPSYMGNSIHLVIAEDLYPEKLPGDEPEPLDIVPYPVKDLEKLLYEPSFCEAYAHAAINFLRLHLQKTA